MKRFAVSVPATSANLGPGFDTIGLALDLRIRADVRVLDPGSRTGVGIQRLRSADARRLAR